MLRQLCLVILLAALVAPSAATPSHQTEAPAARSLDLPPELRQALREEMAALQQAMRRLAEAIPRGDWQAIAETGEGIESTFILHRRLSDAARERLHRALPAEFLRLDRAFHLHAARLALAAQGRDAELVAFYHYRLLDGCMVCHAAYATHRFPGLEERPEVPPTHTGH